MSHLKFDALTTDVGPVLAPVKLERIAWSKHQRHERSSPSSLLCLLTISFPGPHKSRHSFIRSIKAKRYQIGMHLLGRASILPRFALLSHQPA